MAWTNEQRRRAGGSGADISADGLYRYLLSREWRGVASNENWRWFGAKDGAGNKFGGPKSCLPPLLPGTNQDRASQPSALHPRQHQALHLDTSDRNRPMKETEFHPVQIGDLGRHPFVPTAVTLAAYEVYRHVYGPQPAMITGGCRGGFSAGELIAFLYAADFPKDQWRYRVEEAMKRPPRETR